VVSWPISGLPCREYCHLRLDESNPDPDLDLDLDLDRSTATVDRDSRPFDHEPNRETPRPGVLRRTVPLT
jgi:hypothetical protein